MAWQAKLSLGFEAQGARTVLRHRRHEGPLRVQKALWPEATGVCHVILIHPPAGIAGGDELEIAVNLASNSHALLTTPGAGKWYGSAGATAHQKIHLSVGKDAVLEWLPQEIMLFDRAIAASKTRIDLAKTSGLIAWDMLVIGRQAWQEKFVTGQYHNRLSLYQENKLLLQDQLFIEGGDRWLTSPLGMNGHAVMGVLYLVPPPSYRDHARLDDDIDGIRDLIARMQMPLTITRLGEVLVARYLGDDPRQCMDGFAGLRARVRRLWWNLDEAFPRIWKT